MRGREEDLSAVTLVTGNARTSLSREMSLMGLQPPSLPDFYAGVMSMLSTPSCAQGCLRATKIRN